MRSRSNTVGWALLATFVVVSASIGDIESAPKTVRLFQLAYLTGFVGYGLIVWPLLLGRLRVDHSRLWMLGAVVMRLTLVSTVPSDDLYRYLWEGRVQQAGLNPYVLSPEAPELQVLRSAGWKRINHPGYTAIYGPVAELEFRLVASVWPSTWAFKGLHIFFDCVTVGLLALWCRTAGRGAGFAKLYGLCPLVLTAFGIGGHVDSLMLALIAGAGLLISRGSLKWAGVLLGAAATVKIVAGAVWPWLFVKDRWSGLVAVAAAILLHLPYSDAGLAVFDSLIRFSSETAFFGLVHTPLSTCLGGTASRCVSLTILMVIIGLLLFRRRTFEPYCCSVFSAMILMMPVVHYWYLSWVILLLPFRPRLAWPVLAMSMVVYFEASHTRAATGQWVMPAWAFFAAYLPFLAVWAVNSRRLKEQNGGPDPSARTHAPP